MTEPINEQEKENINNENSLDNNIHNYASLTEPTKGTNKGIRFWNEKGLPNHQSTLFTN